jgi:hypothetical protein
MGANQSKQLQPHLQELSDKLDINAEPKSKKSKCQYIFDIYYTSPFLPIISDCLKQNKTFSIDTGGFIDLPFDQGILGLYSKNETFNNKLKRILQPLLQFLVNVKARYSNKEKEKYLNLDSLRIVNGDDYRNKDDKLKIVSNICNLPLFNLICNFISYGNNSQGVRVPIGNLKQQVKQDNCFACLIKIEKDWECGHVLSVEHGGLTILNNLKCLCKNCNRSMSSMHLYEYILRNKLDGIVNIPPNEKKKWKAIIVLTDMANEKGLEKLPLSTRLIKMSFVF